MCSHLKARLLRFRIILAAFLAAGSICELASAQSMRFTYDAAGNVVQRSSPTGAAPMILRQPQANVVAPGGSASFTVIVADAREVTYQWLLNNVDVSGATSDTLFITNVGTGDEGQYSVTVTNTFGSMTSDSVALLLDTNDNELPDSWEVANFGALTTQRAGGDTDGDGVTNLTEFFDGTNPTSSTSLRPRLNITADGGSVNVTPALPSYALGQSVTLTAIPDDSNQFYGWAGDLTSATNPVTISMTANRSVVAHFLCAPIPTGAIAYWRADSDGSDLIGGHSGQFHSGSTAIPARLTSAGHLGSAFVFDGTVHVRVADAAALRPSHFTIELWVYPTVRNSAYQTLLKRGSLTTFDDTYGLDLNNGQVVFWTTHAFAGQNNPLRGTSELPLNQWSHVAATFDGERKNLFVNGSLVASVAGLAPLYYDPAAVPVTMGSDWNQGAPANLFTGRLDEVALHAGAISAAE